MEPTSEEEEESGDTTDEDDSDREECVAVERVLDVESPPSKRPKICDTDAAP